jgi:4-hydroxyproline epimerase
MKRIRVLDSHTGGEPTRLVLEGGPDLGAGPLEGRAALLREKFDAYRSAIVNEPRGSDPMVGALLVPPHRAGCDLGVIFFNNVGTLGMCGHGTIGLVASLAHLGRIAPGRVRLDTPVGAVEALLHADGSVSVDNVPSHRAARQVELEVQGHGKVRGDIAWGGNWFLIITEHPFRLAPESLETLTDFAWRTRLAANAQGHPEVDHVKLSGPAARPDHHSRSFVLCPGKAWDRSPCGTGTSAKLACLAADGKLAEGEVWLQESVIGSVFSARYRWIDRAKGIVAPTITGTAHVMAEATLLLDERDLFCWGIRP